MGLWRSLALINLTNPNALSQDMKNALQAKWQYEITHPKKKSSLGSKIVKGITNVVSTGFKATGNMFEEGAKGNIGKAVSNALTGATGGIVDFTGGANSIVNIHATKYANAALGGGATAATSKMSTSMPSDSTPITTKKGKGLLTQLRKGKGNIGGGSYTETAKNSLGGTSGTMGK